MTRIRAGVLASVSALAIATAAAGGALAAPIALPVNDPSFVNYTSTGGHVPKDFFTALNWTYWKTTRPIDTPQQDLTAIDAKNTATQYGTSCCGGTQPYGI